MISGTIKSILLNADGSGELWYGDNQAIVFDKHWKDVVALLGQEVYEKKMNLEFCGRIIGRLDLNKVNFVSERRFVERVALGCSKVEVL